MTRKMNIIRTTILLCLIALLFSCKKTDNGDNNDQPPVDNWVPDNHYLSLQDRAFFDFFYTNKTIYFGDSVGNQLTFQTDSLFDSTTHQENNLNDGEVLQMGYRCLTTYYPNYAINLMLNAKPDSVVGLSITFLTGTYWNDQGNDYVLSSFYFNPKYPHNVDSINECGGHIHYYFLDSITLQNKTFYNVFYQHADQTQTDLRITKDCYYNHEKGIIAFRNLDGEFWVRQ